MSTQVYHYQYSNIWGGGGGAEKAKQDLNHEALCGPTYKSRAICFGAGAGGEEAKQDLLKSRR